jgi:hypothetical protein
MECHREPLVTGRLILVLGCFVVCAKFNYWTPSIFSDAEAEQLPSCINSACYSPFNDEFPPKAGITGEIMLLHKYALFPSPSSGPMSVVGFIAECRFTEPIRWVRVGPSRTFAINLGTLSLAQ